MSFIVFKDVASIKEDLVAYGNTEEEVDQLYLTNYSYFVRRYDYDSTMIYTNKT